MNISGDWLENPATRALFDVYDAAGFRLLVVGGSVRNALLGLPVTDIDMSSNARPDVARAFLEDAGYRVIPTGIDHGTLTVMCGGEPHEITTFRKDVETDGRRAVVAYSDEIAEDAMRRDFTINALYADRHGHVVDPLGGIGDIDGPRVRFIGDASERIREDYLRSLRFFRFHAQYVPDGFGFDVDSLDAIARNLEGLKSISRERVGSELLKLLGAPDPCEAMGAMDKSGVLGTALTGADPRALYPLVLLESGLGIEPDPVLRLAAICDADAAATLRLRKADLKRLVRLREAAMESRAPSVLGYKFKDDAPAVLALHHAFLESPVPADAMSQISVGQKAVFPVRAADLADRVSGAKLGKMLRKLEKDWIASGFTKTKQQLLA